MKKILVINGPNLDQLGKREPEIYGSQTLSEIEQLTKEKLEQFFPGKFDVHWYQSSSVDLLIQRIHQSEPDGFEAVVFNPGAYSHSSIALYDCIKSLKIPLIEVHLSQTLKREAFRSSKLTARAADSIMEGLGEDGYFLAIASQR